jgi:hypothetical protein
MRKNTMKLRAILSAVVALAFVAAAAAIVPLSVLWAQAPGVPSLLVTSPTGLEQIRVENTGPQVAIVNINQIRNSNGYVAVAAGTTVTTTLTNAQAIAIATGAITTWNLNLPPAPADGQTVEVACPGGNTGTLTIAATLPTSVAIVGTNPTSCTAATPTHSRFLYSTAANTWYRID